MVSWQTVVLSLGAAMLTAGVALAIGILNNRTQRGLHLRTKQIDAASDFSSRLKGAGEALRHARTHPQSERARQDAQHLVGELSPLVGTISLLFGMHTTVEQEASAAVHGLERARDLLAEEDPAGWQAAMDESLGRRAKFEEAARKAVGA